MKITVHQETPTVQGTTEQGQWVERRNGEWVAIDPPARPVTPSARERTPSMPMTDPYVRRDTGGRAAARVTLVRAIEKVAYDYEAEVLARNGWTILQVCPDCLASNFGNVDCINCRAYHGISLDPLSGEYER